MYYLNTHTVLIYLFAVITDYIQYENLVLNKTFVPDFISFYFLWVAKNNKFLLITINIQKELLLCQIVGVQSQSSSSSVYIYKAHGTRIRNIFK